MNTFTNDWVAVASAEGKGQSVDILTYSSTSRRLAATAQSSFSCNSPDGICGGGVTTETTEDSANSSAGGGAVGPDGSAGGGANASSDGHDANTNTSVYAETGSDGSYAHSEACSGSHCR